MAKKVPLRKCLGCEEMKDKRQLIRIVKNKENEFFVDKTGKMNGRGAYICDEKSCFDQLVKSKGLERSFKQAIPREIYDKLKEEFTSE